MTPTVFILVDFLDYKFNNQPNNSNLDWNLKLFGSNHQNLNDYFHEIFENNFSLIPSTESSETANDGIIRVSLDINHPGNITTSTDWNSVISKIILNADPFIDFQSFDSNSDGFLSSSELSINFIFAGNDAAYDGVSSHSVWPHTWCGTYTGTHDNVGLFNCSKNGKYVVAAQMQGDHTSTIGVIAHELGHSIFSLPDLYDTDGSSDGIYFLDLMGTGTWGATPGTDSGSSPVHLSAWSKMKLNHPFTNVENGANSLYKTGESNYKFLKINTPDPKIYYLIEARGNVGSYDEGIKIIDNTYSGGIVVLKVNEYQYTNNIDTNRMVDGVVVTTLPNPTYSQKYFIQNTSSPINLENGGTISTFQTNSSPITFLFSP